MEKERDKERFESLTIENFWNDVSKQYPEEVEVFRKWIEKYNERVGWDVLFANSYRSPFQQWRVGEHRIELHNVPLAMQIGIFMQFLTENDLGLVILYPNTQVSFNTMKKNIINEFARMKDNRLMGRGKECLPCHNCGAIHNQDCSCDHGDFIKNKLDLW